MRQSQLHLNVGVANVCRRLHLDVEMTRELSRDSNVYCLQLKTLEIDSGTVTESVYPVVASMVRPVVFEQPCSFEPALHVSAGVVCAAELKLGDERVLALFALEDCGKAPRCITSDFVRFIIAIGFHFGRKHLRGSRL